MLDSPELYCVTGIQGSGKTTLCRNLAATGEFRVVEKDDKLEELVSGDVLDVMRKALRAQNFPNPDLWLREIDKQGEILRSRMRELVSALSWPGFEAAASLKKTVEDLLKINDDFPLLKVSLERGFFRGILSLLAQQRAIKEAADLALNMDNRVLFADNSLVAKTQRDAALNYLNHRGLDPKLVIVRSTKARLQSVANERGRQGCNEVWMGRDKLPDLTKLESVGADEGWRDILVVNNNTSKKALRVLPTSHMGPASFVI